MWQDALQTFRIIVKANETMPGISVESLVGGAPKGQLEAEYAFLEKQASVNADLLDALEYVMQLVDRIGDPQKDRAYIETARAAIAKARGA